MMAASPPRLTTAIRILFPWILWATTGACGRPALGTVPVTSPLVPFQPPPADQLVPPADKQSPPHPPQRSPSRPHQPGESPDGAERNDGLPQWRSAAIKRTVGVRNGSRRALPLHHL